MRKLVLVLVLVLVLGAFAGEKTTATLFGRGNGHAWRGSAPAPDAPSLKIALEAKGGALSFDAVKGAEAYFAYFFEKEFTVAKGEDEKFWTGNIDGFVAGVEIVPRDAAKKITIVDPNAHVGWTRVYICSVVGKTRTMLDAKWTEGATDLGEDGCKLGDKYRAASK
jgi:hypothetical protein